MRYRKKIKREPRKKKIELIYGPHSLIEMLKAGKRQLLEIYTTDPLPAAWKKVSKYLPSSFSNIKYASKNVLSSMAATSEHRGIVAKVTPFVYATKMFSSKDKKFILLLDSIQDVGNLGGILRTAYCAGVDGVVVCERAAAPLTPAVFKTSAGLAEYLDIYRAHSPKSAIEEIRKGGYNIYLSVLQDGQNALDVKYKKPMCLVIGSEGEGVSKSILGQGERITLPQRKSDISYNASVAAGILIFVMWQLGRD